MANHGCLVGGTNSSASFPGFFDLDAITVSQAHNGNGDSFFADVGISVADAAGSVEITANINGDFATALVGMGIEIAWADDGGGGTGTDGPYFIRSIDTGATPDKLIFDETWDPSFAGDSVSIVIGGAQRLADLQDVLDDSTKGSAASDNVDIYVTGSGATTATIVADAGGGTGTGFTKRVIGTNASYVADGTLAVITAGTADLAGTPIIQIDDISYITFENIHASMTGPAATAGEDGFQIASTALTFRASFLNCKSTNANIGFNHVGGSVNQVHNSFIIDCVSTGSVLYGIFLAGVNCLVETCFIETSGTYGIFIRATGGLAIRDSIIDGGTNGVWFQESITAGLVSIAGCSFYNQTVSCIGANAAKDIGLNAWNNLFFVNPAGTPEPILSTAGVISMSYEDWNFTNAEAAQSTMLTGANSDSALWSDDPDNLWTDAANNDFTVVDAAMIDGGKPTLGDEGVPPVDGFSTPGAHQLTQTQAGGSGGLITHPNMTGGINA